MGLAVVSAGCRDAAVTTSRPGLLVVSAAAILLGAGYGVCMIVVLIEVQQLAAPEDLGALVSVY